jgi:hypothetical protein
VVVRWSKDPPPPCNFNYVWGALYL